MTDTTEMEFTATEMLELRTLAMKLQTDLARFGDQWARRQPRSRGPVPDADARLAMLVAHFVCILEDERVGET
jgi:hypothetical protein